MNIRLRRALLGDAIFETMCALIFILGANALVNWTGWQFPGAFVLAGVGLAAAAALLYWMATRTQINLPLARAVIFLNTLFAVVGLLALILLWGLLNDGGRWLIGVIAALVGVFGALEYTGLRSLSAAK